MYNNITLEFQHVVWNLITERITERDVNYFMLCDTFCIEFIKCKERDSKAKILKFGIFDDGHFYNVTINRALGDVSFDKIN